RAAVERDGELLLAAGECARVRGAPGQEHAGDLVVQQRQQRGLERVPAFPVALDARLEHALDPRQRTRRTLADDRARRRVAGALVELSEQPEVAEGRTPAEEVRPAMEV